MPVLFLSCRKLTAWGDYCIELYGVLQYGPCNRAARARRRLKSSVETSVLYFIASDSVLRMDYAGQYKKLNIEFVAGYDQHILKGGLQTIVNGRLHGHFIIAHIIFGSSQPC